MKDLSTEPYKGTRDFYPEDQAVENYIFNTWKKTAESFGYEEYNASILESSELYKTKTSEEIVNEQTYTFTDRGDREVTLRPEMTPTVARMIAAKQKELSFPLRWYSIPNLFRYERPQKGRLREHWQLNCDIFGISSIKAEVEIISLAYKIMKNFGATEDDFVIKINSRKILSAALKEQGFNDTDARIASRLLDKKSKIENFDEECIKMLGKKIDRLELSPNDEVKDTIEELNKLGIKNIKFDPEIVRGFDYYNGIVFEIYDTNKENSRSIFGGGRYDNLMDIFGKKPVPAVGFGMGDVITKDFLELRNLLTK